VRVAIQKLPGVESVEVSLTRAVTDVRFTAGNAVTIAQLREIIRKSGFNPGESLVVATGRLVDQAEGRLGLEVVPGKWTILLEPDPARAGAIDAARKLRKSGAAAVEVTGTVGPKESLLVREVTIAATPAR
jgi:hypothetical protein